MTHQIMTFWFKRQPKLIHDYSLVGYILSPNLRIMNNARERMLDSPIYSDAVKCLIGKLLVPENVTSTERKECLAEMTTKFFDEHQKFVNQKGILDSDTLWYTAQGRVTLLLHVVGTILGCYQEPRYLENWLSRFYPHFLE
jgi:hypothetical protein